MLLSSNTTDDTVFAGKEIECLLDYDVYITNTLDYDAYESVRYTFNFKVPCYYNDYPCIHSIADINH